MRARATPIWTVPGLLALVVLLPAGPWAQERTSTSAGDAHVAARDSVSKRTVRRLPEPEDPLEPWSLEPAARPGPLPPADTGTTPEAARDTTGALQPGPIPAAEAASPEKEESVLVVRLRQVLVSAPDRAERLEALLDLGVPFDEATAKLGITDVVESMREYAVDELHPQVRAQVEVLPDSGWSQGRVWRGRSVFFQVLAREERARSRVPKLGEGLDEAERRRLAGLVRTPDRSRDRSQQGDEMNLQPASVVEQVAAEYPPGATESGEVTLLVEVGRLGQVLDVSVEKSTDSIFEGPAIDAARASSYRSARRGPGIAEPGSVRLTYKFTAPEGP
ncbi:MAG: energy transducer TonB [Candidatus Krumholzibacteriia bacterium]